MLGSDGWNEFNETEVIRESETDLVSNLPQEKRNSNREEFISMLHSSSAVERKKTLENVCTSREEFNNRKTKKLNEKTSSINVQTQQAVDLGINE